MSAVWPPILLDVDTMPQSHCLNRFESQPDMRDATPHADRVLVMRGAVSCCPGKRSESGWPPWKDDDQYARTCNVRHCGTTCIYA